MKKEICVVEAGVAGEVAGVRSSSKIGWMRRKNLVGETGRLTGKAVNEEGRPATWPLGNAFLSAGDYHSGAKPASAFSKRVDHL
jgi:hypothetical protein